MSGEPSKEIIALKKPPAPDELEVSVFGPGIGEAIVLHLGDGKWTCIDSAKLNGRAWALSYLEELSVAPTQVCLILATHWHSDHVDGLSEIVHSCPSVQFVCSNALRVDEFKALLARFLRPDSERIRAPLIEIRSILQTYGERRKNDRHHPAPVFAQARLLLYRIEDVAGCGPLEIWSLSPSPEDVLGSRSEFANLFVPLDQYANGLDPIGQNSSCIVVMIKIGMDVILLGSDLERTNSNSTGWNAVVNAGFPLTPASAFKIPHHGSAGAYSQELWNNFIQPGAVAVVTPFTPSGLPRTAELDRLRAMGCELYVTALPHETAISRSLDVQREIKGMTKSFRSLYMPDKNGVVRLRKKIGQGTWAVETFLGARRYQ
jgi:beta-lactamase superfamily II metal-dependent hydrolase